MSKDAEVNLAFLEAPGSCPCCHGAGKIDGKYDPRLPEKYYADYICPECQGTGIKT